MSMREAIAGAVETAVPKYTAAFPFSCTLASTHPDRAAHRDAYTELAIILSGSAVHFTEAGAQRVAPGDVLVVHGACAHGYREVNRLKLVNIMFDAGEFLPDSADVRAHRGFQRMFEEDTPTARQRGFFAHTRLPREAFTHVETLAWRIDNECKLRRPGYQTLVRALFTDLVITIARAYRARQETPVHEGIARAVEFIDTHYAEELTLAQIVKVSGLSSAQFHRLFRRHIRFRPLWYLRNVRLNHAAVLLRTTNRSITHITLAVGFNDSNYFARAFRVAMGMSPREYRKTCLGKRGARCE
ncbi:MAG: AraC family transcriptional regulator [bacterium]|nr:AraC family transcriptional regulator [bacterium]